MPYEGEGLSEIEASLRSQVGPPAETFAELRDAEYFGARAWYIDTFEDLVAAPAHDNRNENGIENLNRRRTVND